MFVSRAVTAVGRHVLNQFKIDSHGFLGVIEGLTHSLGAMLRIDSKSINMAQGFYFLLRCLKRKAPLGLGAMLIDLKSSTWLQGIRPIRSGAMLIESSITWTN